MNGVWPNVARGEIYFPREDPVTYLFFQTVRNGENAHLPPPTRESTLVPLLAQCGAHGGTGGTRQTRPPVCWGSARLRARGEERWSCKPRPCGWGLRLASLEPPRAPQQPWVHTPHGDFWTLKARWKGGSWETGQKLLGIARNEAKGHPRGTRRPAVHFRSYETSRGDETEIGETETLASRMEDERLGPDVINERGLPG